MQCIERILFKIHNYYSNHESEKMIGRAFGKDLWPLCNNCQSEKLELFSKSSGRTGYKCEVCGYYFYNKPKTEQKEVQQSRICCSVCDDCVLCNSRN